MDEPTTPLDYAKRPTPAARIVRHRRLIVALAIAVTIVPVSKVAIQEWGELQHWWLRRKCLVFSLPPSTVVFDDDPVRAKNLLALGKYVSSHPALGTATGSPFALLPIREFDDYAVPSQWAAPVVFLHERISPAGHRRLVVIHISLLPNDPFNRIFFDHYLEQDGVTGNASRSQDRSVEMYRLPAEAIGIYAGQPDASDSSHFTIDYLLNNRRETIDGWLNDDNSVYLIPRCGQIYWLIPNTIWMPGNSAGPDWGIYSPHPNWNNWPIPPRAVLLGSFKYAADFPPRQCS